MDLKLSEMQSALKESVRDFLTDKCPKTLVRELNETRENYSPSMWREIAGLGWVGMCVPEDFGGAGADFLDLVIVLEEMGKALLPSPFVSTSLFGLAIDAAGSTDQKQQFLSKLTRGDLIGCIALTEPSGSLAAGAVQVGASVTSDGFVVNGTKLFVRDANIADYAICVVRTSEADDPKQGFSLLIVDLKAPGVDITPLHSVGHDRQNEVVFAGAKVPMANLLGEEGKGWRLVEKILQWGAVAECAEMVGAEEQVIEMTVQHVKERVQFGVPIGSFQAVQHMCADMATAIDGGRLITRRAAWKISEGLPAATDVSRAKVFVGDSFRRVSRSAHELHGGAGFTIEHDLPLFFGKQKVGESVYGDADFHRKIVAAATLD